MLFQLRIDLTGGDKQIGQAVIIQIYDSRAPANVTGLHAQAGLQRHVGEFALSIVFVKHTGVVGEMSFENAECSIQLIVSDADAHTRLLGAVFAEGDAAFESFFEKCSVVPVAEVEAGCGIASHVNIGPAIAIEIRGDSGESVGAHAIDARLFAHVAEMAVTIVVKQIAAALGKAAWTTVD